MSDHHTLITSLHESVHKMSSTRVPMSDFDNIMPRIYAYTIYCLPLSVAKEPRDIHAYLEKALAITVEQIPWLGGTVKVGHPAQHNGKKGRLDVILPDQTSHVPLRFKDHRSKLDYDDLMTEGLPDDSLGGELLLPTGLIPDIQNGAAVLVAQANFLQGGCFLSVGIHHTVADGSAAVSLMQIWAHHCWQLQNPVISRPATQISAEGLNRNILKELWLAEGNVHDEAAYRTASEKLWRFLGVNSVVDDPDISKETSAPPTDTSIFYVSGSSFSELKNAGTQSNVSGVTANDSLMAFLWRAITKARFPPKDPIYERDETAILDTTVDGRAHFSASCPQDYFGNLVLMNTTSLPLKSVTSPTTNLSTIAAAIRTTLDSITTTQAHAAMTLAASLPDCNALTFPFATFEGTELCITSTVNMPLFHLDFGPAFENGGKPESIRSPKSEFASICRRCVVLPRRTNGGFEILISLVQGEMERLMADEEFAQFARFCCH